MRRSRCDYIGSGFARKRVIQVRTLRDDRAASASFGLDDSLVMARSDEHMVGTRQLFKPQKADCGQLFDPLDTICSERLRAVYQRRFWPDFDRS